MSIIVATTTLNITSNSGKSFPVTIEVTKHSDETLYTSIQFKAFDVRVSLDKLRGIQCIVVPVDQIKKSSISKVFGNVPAKTQAAIGISDEMYQQIEDAKIAILAPYKKLQDDAKAALEADRNAMPRKLVYGYSFYWGDYSTEVTSTVKIVRSLTPFEIENGVKYRAEPGKMDLKFRHVETIIPNVIYCDLLKEITARPSIGHQEGLTLYEVTETEVDELRKVAKAWQQSEDEKKAAKEEEQRIAKEVKAATYAAEKKDAEENELFVWDAGVIYSSAGNKMLHSLGATFSEKTISIYTTSYSRDIPNANTTYSIKETLKAAGFVFNPETKNWDIAFSEENGNKTIELLKKYDTKAWPSTAGLERCWECGTYFKPKKGDYDSGMPYCGC